MTDEMSIDNDTYYDLHAGDVPLEDITSSAQNANILRLLRDGDIQHMKILGQEEEHDDNDEEEQDQEQEVLQFIVRKDDRIGWLAYFLRKSEVVRTLSIHDLTNEQIGVLMNGVKRNVSIQCFILMKSDCDGDQLAHFITHNSNLKSLRLWYLRLGHLHTVNFARFLASALTQREEKTMTELSLKGNEFSNDEVSEIVAAVSEYKQLETLYISEDLIGRDVDEYYQILADSITLESITTCQENKEILMKLRDDEWDESAQLSISEYITDEDLVDGIFFSEEDNEWEWLGYFLGRSKQIKYLNLYCQPEEDDNTDAFMNGLCRNKSIEQLKIIDWEIECSYLGPFIMSNNNLKSLDIWHVDIGPEWTRNLTSALSQRQHKSLTRLSLNRNNLSIESLLDIAESLRSYTLLETLDLSKNLIGRDICSQPEVIFLVSELPIKELFLCNIGLDDKGMWVLAAAVAQSMTLQSLSLSGNQSVTVAGLMALNVLLSSACPLQTLYLEHRKIGDDGAMALADGLKGNTTLKKLVLSPRFARITSVGWSAFSKLLCDKSSINNTYRSNHTLEQIGDEYYEYYHGNYPCHFRTLSLQLQQMPLELLLWILLNISRSTNHLSVLQLPKSISIILTYLWRLFSNTS